MNNRLKSVILKSCAMTLATVMILSMSACKKNPDSIIKNKDMDRLIDEASKKKQSDIGIDELMAKYNTYKTTVKNDSLKVTLNVDAKVSIPRTDKMSIIKVSQTKISQELLDKVRKELVGDTPLYDGKVFSIPTKKDIEEDIKSRRNEIALFKDQPDYENGKYDKAIADFQKSIDELEKQYIIAPSVINPKSIPSDYKLKSVSEEYKKNKEDEFYSHLYQLDKKMEVYEGISGGEDNNFITLSVTNSPDYGNRLSFLKGKNGYLCASTLTGLVNRELWPGDTLPKDAKADVSIGFNSKLVQCPEDTVKKYHVMMQLNRLMNFWQR